MNAQLALSILGDSGTFVRAGVVRLLGGNGNAAILLSQYLYWQQRAGLGQWFYNTGVSLEEQTGLSANVQTRARKNLVDAGLIEQQLKRGPNGAPVVHVRVLMDVLMQLIASDTQTADFTQTVKSISRNSGNPFPATSEMGFPEEREMLINKDYQRLLKEREAEPEKTGTLEAHTPSQIEQPKPAVPARDEWRQARELADHIHDQLSAETRRNLIELRKFDKRSEQQYWAWLREHIAPHLERLGDDFKPAAALAVKKAVTSNPGFCLRDFAAALEAYQPAPAPKPQARAGEYDYFDEIVREVFGGGN